MKKLVLFVAMLMVSTSVFAADCATLKSNCDAGDCSAWELALSEGECCQ